MERINSTKLEDVSRFKNVNRRDVKPTEHNGISAALSGDVQCEVMIRTQPERLFFLPDGKKILSDRMNYVHL